jgi:hypothetical protein
MIVSGGLGGSVVIAGGDGDDSIACDCPYRVAVAVHETGIALISNFTVTVIWIAPRLTSMGMLDSGDCVSGAFAIYPMWR